MLSKIGNITFACALAVVSAQAQSNSIHGTVQDAVGPLPYATIAIGKNGTTADSLGQFILENVPVGEQIVNISYVGYLPQKVKVQVSSEFIAMVSVKLDPAGMLDEVVVTGTMKPGYVSESPVKIDVLPASQLEKFMPAAATSVIEGIQMINGVEEVVACGVCFTNSISVNGLPGQYTAILMDGMPVYGNLASVYGLNGIPSMIIDRYEVIKGPSSTLYGSEAVGGVINIITKDPGTQPVLNIDIMGTSHAESFGNLAFAPQIGKSSGFVGLNYASTSDFADANNDGFGDVAQLDRISLFTKWNINRKSDNLFSLAGKVYLEDRRNGVEEFLKDRAYRDLRGSNQVYGESIYTARYELFGTYGIGFIDGLRADFSLSYHDQDSYYGSDYYNAKQGIAYVNFVWNKVMGKHDFTGGASARYQTYDDNTIATQELEDQAMTNNPDKQFIPGIYVQDEWRPSNKWTLLPGMRLDYYKDHGIIPAPRLSVKYDISNWTQARINFGTGFRIVNLFTEDHAFVTGQRDIIIEESLNPERSVSTALNVHHIFVFGNGSGSFDIDAFYTYFSNKITPDYDNPGAIVYTNSKGHARTAGVAATFNYNFGFPLGIQVSSTVQDPQQTDFDEQGNAVREALEFAPKYSGLVSANCFWTKAGLTLAYTMRLTGPMRLPAVFDLDDSGVPWPEPRPQRSEPFSVHNLQLTKEFGESLRIYAGVQNLFNQLQPYSPVAGYNDPTANPGFSDSFDTAYAYGTLHGREFYLGVNWRLGRGR